MCWGNPPSSSHNENNYITQPRLEPEPMTRPLRIAILCAIALHCTHLIAAETKDPSRLTVQRIFGAHEFEAEQVTMRWLEGDDGYTRSEEHTSELQSL